MEVRTKRKMRRYRGTEDEKGGEKNAREERRERDGEGDSGRRDAEKNH